MAKEVQVNITARYQLLETNDFFLDQIDEVQKSEVRAWIQTMALEPSYFSNLLLATLIQAFSRGVDARFVHDAYSDYVVDNKFTHLAFLLNSDSKKEHEANLVRRRAFINQLNTALPVAKTNVPKSPIRFTPFAAVSGRDHKKISIIDRIAYLGGVNMTSLDTRRMDVMLKTDNPEVVRGLADIYSRSFYQEDIDRDLIIPCGDSNSLLIDSGKRGKSIIMEHVYDLIAEETDRVLLISPYVPSSKLRNVMNAAVKKDIHVELITTGSADAVLSQRISQLVHNVGLKPPSFVINRYPGIVHAKVLVLGDHTAVIGSHNFDELFVQLGTEEISLLTHQPELIAQLISYGKKLGWSYA